MSYYMGKISLQWYYAEHHIVAWNSNVGTYKGGPLRAAEVVAKLYRPNQIRERWRVRKYASNIKERDFIELEYAKKYVERYVQKHNESV